MPLEFAFDFISVLTGSVEAAEREPGCIASLMSLSIRRQGSNGGFMSSQEEFSDDWHCLFYWGREWLECGGTCEGVVLTFHSCEKKRVIVICATVFFCLFFFFLFFF